MTTTEHRSPAPQSVIAAYARAFFALQQSTVTLTDTHRLTLADIFEPPDLPENYMNRDWLLDPGKQMAAEVRAWAARDPHHAERWGADAVELADICESWQPAQAFGVLAAIDRHWTTLDVRDLPGHQPQEPDSRQ